MPNNTHFGFAAGLSKEGIIPVIPLYSSFVQRGFDQVVHDIAIQNLPVVICLDRSGVVGKDGETHQGMLDMSILSSVPNLTIMSPKDFGELEDMLEFAVNKKSPVIIRYPRGSEDRKFRNKVKIECGKSEIVETGEDITIVAIGKMVSKAKKISEKLLKDNIKTEIINARFIKPLDENTIINSIKKTKCIISIEDGTIVGGLGSKIESALVKHNLENIKFEKIAYPDEFIVHGDIKNLEKKYHLDDDFIYNIAKEMVENKNSIKKLVSRGEKCIKTIKKKIEVMKKNY